MKNLFIIAVLAVIAMSCTKEPTPEPTLPAEICLTCIEQQTGEQFSICDDTLTVRVWGEYFDFQNRENGNQWKCTKAAKE